MAVIHDLFELLPPLPIEILSINNPLPLGFERLLADSLPLFPALLLVMLPSLNREFNVVKSKCKHLLLEASDHHHFSIWPPMYQKLSPEAQAIFRYRPYVRHYSFVLCHQ
jgi:hypothetical protein